MSESEDWDIEQYKSEHESEEHWDLRRKFLETHKGKFPEDELICLAQVFVNVELLGCRYPKETMQVIAELAKDVVGEYRERQKTKLQRTFVAASDAASSKVKGLNAPRSTNLKERKAEGKDTSISNKEKYRLQSNIPFKRQRVEQPYGNIVIIEKPNDVPQNILCDAVRASGGNIEWKFDKAGDNCKCVVLLNSKQLAEACEVNQKAAKREASVNGLQELRKYYYTIKVKCITRENATVTTASMLEKPAVKSISTDNVGMKLMKLMGWSGGGLGKSEQGIVEPVTKSHDLFVGQLSNQVHFELKANYLCSVKEQISKKGLGLKSTVCTTNELKKRARDAMHRYLSGDMKDDLIFSSDFTNDERAVIHEVARHMGLKSHSYGPKTQRTLVVCRKIDPQDLVEELKSLGGKTDKYQLIEPLNL